MKWVALAAASMAVLAAGGVPHAVAQTVDGPSSRKGAVAAAEWRARGLELGYNLDRTEAFEAFQRAIDADPHSPAAYRLLAAAAWVGLVFEQGAVTADDFLGEARATYRRATPNADFAKIFRSALDRAIALSEQHLRARPDDAAARFHAGAAYGFQAAYTATIEGRLFGSLEPARRAYREHQRVLELDATRKEAGMIVGMYRYAVSTLSVPLRLGAVLAGFGGGRAEGLRLVEDAAAHPSEVRANAQFTLVVIYSRESRFDDALRVIRSLQRQFPRNRLLWLEEGSAALRAGRPKEAQLALEAGLARLARDTRPRAPGEESRWRLAYGSALVANRELAAAGHELRLALELSTRDWVRGRAHTELGKLADIAGDRSRALEQYRQAYHLCRSDNDGTCSSAARALAKKGYQ